MDDDSWNGLDPPEDLGAWRVYEPFRDKTISLAQLDLFVSEFDQGCLDGRLHFLQFVQKAVVGEREFAEERQRVQKEERRLWQEQREQEQREEQERLARYHLVRLGELWTDFNSGYVIQGEWCGDSDCNRPTCQRLFLYELWKREREKVNG